MKSILNLIRSMWVIAPLIVFCFATATSASGMPAAAFAHDELTQSTIAYDAPSPSALDYDSASVAFVSEKGNRTPRNGGAFTGFAGFLAPKEGATFGRAASTDYRKRVLDRPRTRLLIDPFTFTTPQLPFSTSRQAAQP
jgi:hypothetical protein